MESTITFYPTHFEVALNDVRMMGTIVDVDPETGKATGVTRVSVDEQEANQLAALAQLS
jgi:hypothetical protein